VIHRQIYKTTQPLAYVASGRSQLALPDTGFITHIDLLFRWNIQSLVGTVRPKRQDGDAMIVNALQVKASSTQNYYDTSDGRQLKFKNVFDYRSQHGNSLPQMVGHAAVAAADYYSLFRLHWGYNPFNPFDGSGVMPARLLQNPLLEINWGAFTDLYPSAVAGVDYNLAASDVTVQIYELAFTENGEWHRAWPKGLPSPRIESEIRTVRSVHSNLSLEVDVPVGDAIWQTIIFAEDQTTGVRQDGIGTATQSGPTEIGIKLPLDRSTRYRFDWETFKWYSKVQSDVQEHAAVSAVDTNAGPVTINRYNFWAPTNVPHVGAGLIRWPDLTARKIGLDMTKAQQGDAKIGFTCAHDGVNDFRIHLLHFMMGRGKKI
jgi:hypothetical protein